MKYVPLLIVLLVSLTFAVDFVVVGNYSFEEFGDPEGMWVIDDHVLTFSSDKENLYIMEWDSNNSEWDVIKRVGSSDPNSEKYIGGIKDLWVDEEGILYVLTTTRDVVIFNASDDFSYISTLSSDESYIPDEVGGIAAYDNLLFISDRKNGQVNIAKRYDDKHYKYIVEGAVSYAYLGDYSASFDDPRDLWVYEGVLYVVDQGHNSVKMFDINDNYKYLGDFSATDRDIDMRSPKKVMVDSDYLYYTDGLETSIKVVYRENEKTIDVIDGFDSISGMYVDGDYIYVGDDDLSRIFVIYINRTSKLSLDDVEDYINEFNSKFDELCVLEDVGNSLDLSISDLCDELRELNSSNLTVLLDAKDYDNAYQLVGYSMLPKVEGGLSYYPSAVDDKLGALYDDLKNQLEHYNVMNLTGVPKTQLLNTYDKYYEGLRVYRAGNYSEAYDYYKEISADLSYLKTLLNEDNTNDDSEIASGYLDTLNDYVDQYDEIKSDLAKYGISSSKVDSLIETIGEEINDGDFDSAYNDLTVLSEELESLSVKLNEHKEAVKSVEMTLSQFRSDINASNKTFLVIKTDLSRVLELYSKAEGVYVKDPELAESYLKQAADELESASKNFEDSVFLAEVAVVALLFIGVLLFLLTSGVLIYKAHKHAKKKEPPKWTGWKGKN